MLYIALLFKADLLLNSCKDGVVEFHSFTILSAVIRGVLEPGRIDGTIRPGRYRK